LLRRSSSAMTNKIAQKKHPVLSGCFLNILKNFLTSLTL
jgi:hypothetical protein